MGDTALRISGRVGRLSIGYQMAAEFADWHLELLPRLPREYVVTANIRTASDYWLAERPLTLTLEIGPDVWSWSSADVTIDIQRLTARVVGTPTVARGAAPQEQQA